LNNYDFFYNSTDTVCEILLEDILAEIKKYAMLFKNNFDFDIVNEELNDKFGIERLNAIIFGLETTTLIPFVLYILKNVDD